MSAHLLAIDLFAGLGGWTEALLAEGYYVVGFDIERHEYGNHRYPGQLVLQDVRTLHGSQFKGAALIVASPPCQEFSWMAMPWSRAKQVARALLGQGEFPANYCGSRTIAQLTELFDASFRIQREACEAAGRHIPMVVENVRGAQPWVGRARWNFGSFFLWGDVPALMPMARKHVKVATMGGFNTHAERATKNTGGSWFNVPHNTTSGCGQNARQQAVDHLKTTGHANIRNGYSHTRHLTNPAEHDGIKQHKSGRAWFADPDTMSGRISSKSPARKAASAMIAKIPETLARHIARVYASAPSDERK